MNIPAAEAIRDPEFAKRFLEKCSPSRSGCWLWTGCVDRWGYGKVALYRRTTAAHRASYRLFVGPLEADLAIDHLCRVRNCVNPEHLEAVPKVINDLRGFSPPAVNARKVTCKRGHPLFPRRSGTGRVCRACGARNQRASRLRKRARLLAQEVTR
jgi:hypothetical protein